MSLKSLISKRLPEGVRKTLWYLTDSEYRKEFRANWARRKAFLQRRAEIAPHLWRQTQGIVPSGPFVGMKFLDAPAKTFCTSKMLGVYELEIHPILKNLETDYQTIVDIGAAEGYYACGLAMRMPRAKVRGFEAQPEVRAEAERLLKRNQVADRVDLQGFCTPELLASALQYAGKCLVVCDVDGGEFQLLDPQLIPALRQCDLLVEVHDAIVPNITQILTERFSPSHSVQFVQQEPRRPSDLPSGIQLEVSMIPHALDEFRPIGNDWLWMKSLKKATA